MPKFVLGLGASWGNPQQGAVVLILAVRTSGRLMVLYEGSVKWQLPSLVITDDICLWVNEGVKEEKNAHGKRGVTQWQW